MLRALAVALGLVAIAWLEFAYFPGHTWLASTSQLYVPMLQHLEAPGYLSRDLLASHPNVTFTAYDEATLFLHRAAHLDLRRALVWQQGLSRLGMLLGVFLLARAAGLRRAYALAVAGLLCLGTYLPGVDAWLIEAEPIPSPMASGFIFLALGCLAREKPLLSGLCGGIAFLYDPILTLPFWMFVVTGLLVDRRLRPLVRPMMPILLVFALLLANLAQLQPGTPESQYLITRIPLSIAGIDMFRVPSSWVSLWPRSAVHLYPAIFVVGAAAVTRIWPLLNRPSRWLFTFLPCVSVLSIPLSAFLVDHLRWSLALRVQSTRTLIYLVALTWLACAIAGLRSWRSLKRGEAVTWGAACLLVLCLNFGGRGSPLVEAPTAAMADWAENKTWGSSVFLFCDAERASYPGRFRAQSRRALWVDWMSGAQVNASPESAEMWFTRWTDTMSQPVPADGLPRLLSLPIDYLVFERGRVVQARIAQQVRTIEPVFSNGSFSVYEASGLRTTPGELGIVWRAAAEK